MSVKSCASHRDSLEICGTQHFTHPDMQRWFSLVLIAVFANAATPSSSAEDLPSDVILAKKLIESFTQGNKVDGWPHMGPMPRWIITVDTYTQEVSSLVIADLYNRTCEKIQEHYKADMKTYSWNDVMGWPRLATVVQFKISEKPSSYLLVTAVQNNDNDHYSFAYKDGEFNPEGKKLLTTWAIPKGHLREDIK